MLLLPSDLGVCGEPPKAKEKLSLLGVPPSSPPKRDQEGALSAGGPGSCVELVPSNNPVPPSPPTSPKRNAIADPSSPAVSGRPALLEGHKANPSSATGWGPEASCCWGCGDNPKLNGEEDIPPSVP